MTNSTKERHTRGYEGERNRGFKVGTLWCSRHDISGDVTLGPDFDGWPFRAKIDFLEDVIGLLETEYKKIRKEEGE
jgi:hypothetical protein